METQDNSPKTMLQGKNRAGRSNMNRLLALADHSGRLVFSGLGAKFCYDAGFVIKDAYDSVYSLGEAAAGLSSAVDCLIDINMKSNVSYSLDRLIEDGNISLQDKSSIIQYKDNISKYQTIYGALGLARAFFDESVNQTAKTLDNFTAEIPVTGKIYSSLSGSILKMRGKYSEAEGYKEKNQEFISARKKAYDNLKKSSEYVNSNLGKEEANSGLLIANMNLFNDSFDILARYDEFIDLGIEELSMNKLNNEALKNEYLILRSSTKELTKKAQVMLPEKQTAADYIPAGSALIGFFAAYAAINKAASAAYKIFSGGKTR